MEQNEPIFDLHTNRDLGPNNPLLVSQMGRLANGNGAMRFSQDGGETWSEWTEVITSGPRPVVSYLSAEDVAAGNFDPEYWQARTAYPDTPLDNAARLMKSDDNW